MLRVASRSLRYYAYFIRFISSLPGIDCSTDP